MEHIVVDANVIVSSFQVADKYGLRGADSVVVALAEELNMPLKTFDKEILDRFQRASV